MPKFGAKSRALLEGLHPYLRQLLEEAVVERDITIVSGFRGKEEQDELLRNGKTTLAYPKSKHNTVATQVDVDLGFAANVGAPLARGVDIALWHSTVPHILWNRSSEFYLLAGYLTGLAKTVLPHGWSLRVGADWDGDGDTTDQKFHDLGHIELIGPNRA